METSTMLQNLKPGVVRLGDVAVSRLLLGGDPLGGY